MWWIPVTKAKRTTAGLKHIPKTELYVKPSNHEAAKHRKYKTDISRRENMVYDAQADTYTCANGKLVQRTREKKTHTASGLEIATSVYECNECDGCPLKEKCIRACPGAPS